MEEMYMSQKTNAGEGNNYKKTHQTKSDNKTEIVRHTPEDFQF